MMGAASRAATCSGATRHGLANDLLVEPQRQLADIAPAGQPADERGANDVNLA